MRSELAADRLRIPQIDSFRGLIMILMTLDHTRDFLGQNPYEATDLSRASALLFFSRWVTHICAPGFIFLAGLSLSLKMRTESKPQTARFVITRGILFVVIEQTVLRCFGWYFNFDFRYMNAGILWGIGCSFVIMGALLFTKERYALLIGLALTGFFALNGISQLSQAWIWKCLVSGGDIEFLPDYHFYVSYPALPWFAIMAMGFGSRTFFVSEAGLNHRRILWIGIISLILFVLLRLAGLGNPTRFQVLDSGRTLLSFINLTKYPPSICFLLMTLGIGFIVMGSLKFWPPSATAFLQIPGQMPFIYYALHIPLIHLIALILAMIRYGRAEWLYEGPGIFWSEALPGHPPDYGFVLPIVYLFTAIVVILLYKIVKVLYELKQKSPRDSWLRFF